MPFFTLRYNISSAKPRQPSHCQDTQLHDATSDYSLTDYSLTHTIGRPPGPRRPHGRGGLLRCCRPRVMQGSPPCCRLLPTAASSQRYNRRQSHDSGGWLCFVVPRYIMSTHPMHFSGWPIQRAVNDFMIITSLIFIYLSLAGNLQQLVHVQVQRIALQVRVDSSTCEQWSFTCRHSSTGCVK